MGNVLSINRTPQDFVSKTRHLSVEDRGAYQEILDQIVILGQDEDPPSLPDDDRFIAHLLGWSVKKWRRTKANLCSGRHAVLVTAGNRISQTRIVEEIEAAKQRIASARGAGIASGESRRAKLRERMLNGRSTDVEPSFDDCGYGQRTDGERMTNAEANGSRTDCEPATSYELRATSYEKSVTDSATPLELPTDGLEAVDIIGYVWSTLLPNANPLDEFTVAMWLRDRHPHPWCIAAALCEGMAKLPEARNPERYAEGIVKNRVEWSCEILPIDEVESFVTHSLNPDRRARMALVSGGVA